MFEEVVHNFSKSDDLVKKNLSFTAWFHVNLDQKILIGLYCTYKRDYIQSLPLFLRLVQVPVLYTVGE